MARCIPGSNALIGMLLCACGESMVPSQDAGIAPRDAFVAPQDAPSPPRADGGPRNVLPCDQLGEIGVWEEVTPPGAGPGFSNVAVDPNNAGALFAGGVANDGSLSWGGPGNGLWRSRDCGASFEHINTGRGAEAIESGSLVYILIDPTDSNRMYTNSLYGGLGIYRSTNGGVDWDDIRPRGEGIPDFVQGEAMDPDDAQHLLLTFHLDCGGGHNGMCIAETTNGGDDWRIFDGPSDAHGWIEQAGLFFLARGTWLLGAPGLGLYYTDSSGATWEQVMGYPGCHGFGKLIQIDGQYYLPCWGGLATSADGHAWRVVEGTPHGIALERAGQTLFMSFTVEEGVPYWTAPVSDPSDWTRVSLERNFQFGSFGLAYDEDHHLLYAASYSDGLWRVRTE